MAHSLTRKEAQLLSAIVSSEYQDSDNPVNKHVWWFSVEHGLGRSISGVVSSCSKKEFAHVRRATESAGGGVSKRDSDLIWITQAGFDALEAYSARPRSRSGRYYLGGERTVCSHHYTEGLQPSPNNPLHSHPLIPHGVEFTCSVCNTTYLGKRLTSDVALERGTPTQKEAQMLRAITKSEYHDGSDPVNVHVWWFSIRHELGRAASGVMASLSKKSWAKTRIASEPAGDGMSRRDSDLVWITQDGVEALQRYDAMVREKSTEGTQCK